MGKQTKDQSRRAAAEAAAISSFKLELKERQQNAESSLAEARLEVKELHVQLENLR
jgi:hypothetical protein